MQDNTESKEHIYLKISREEDSMTLQYEDRNVDDFVDALKASCKADMKLAACVVNTAAEILSSLPNNDEAMDCFSNLVTSLRETAKPELRIKYTKSKFIC